MWALLDLRLSLFCLGTVYYLPLKYNSSDPNGLDRGSNGLWTCLLVKVSIIRSAKFVGDSEIHATLIFHEFDNHRYGYLSCRYLGRYRQPCQCDCGLFWLLVQGTVSRSWISPYSLSYYISIILSKVVSRIVPSSHYQSLLEDHESIWIL